MTKSQTPARRTFLIRWEHGNGQPQFMMVEADCGWRARDYATEFLENDYGRRDARVDVLVYLVNGDNGVEDLS